MVKCKKCDTENEGGVIYCKGCKAPLYKFTPESIVVKDIDLNKVSLHDSPVIRLKFSKSKSQILFEIIFSPLEEVYRFNNITYQSEDLEQRRTKIKFVDVKNFKTNVKKVRWDGELEISDSTQKNVGALKRCRLEFITDLISLYNASEHNDTSIYNAKDYEVPYFEITAKNIEVEFYPEKRDAYSFYKPDIFAKKDYLFIFERDAKKWYDELQKRERNSNKE